MSPKLVMWIELLIAAAATGALNATANLAAAPELFQHGNYVHLLVRMGIVGALLSVRDQLKKSPMPDVPTPVLAPETANSSTAARSGGAGGT